MTQVSEKGQKGQKAVIMLIFGQIGKREILDPLMDVDKAVIMSAY